MCDRPFLIFRDGLASDVTDFFPRWVGELCSWALGLLLGELRSELIYLFLKPFMAPAGARPAPDRPMGKDPRK